MEKSQGIIIRLTKLTETSLIVHWCTQEEGLLKTVAKGGRRAKSPFAGKLDLFFQAEMSWVKSRKSELHTLRELVVSDFREPLRHRYRDMVTASYFVDVLATVVEPGLPVPELYDLLQRALDYLRDEGADMRGLLHYERELARMLGVQHQKMSPLMSLERAFGAMPRGRKQCLDVLDNTI
ncbi:DNA repair protein RecO [Verrucomicrobiaceae bacterium N1E253]|uniref:DNA repair protein RecO n=1 Tax=Oceaniferula marina TaxID=2748318 RepID=A0A851GFZ1_9BACT|nr:DNA repair protein RecO [Oceaniferula marina]NWK56306.1 DNA repair protein RecO [Oceaniferula marina]